MSELYFTLQHGGGTHRVMIENQGDTTLISFGASFTLRLDEENLNKLREHIHNAARDMCIERRDTTGVGQVADHEINAENEMIQSGIDAREALKLRRMVKAEAAHVDWNPNDPANW